MALAAQLELVKLITSVTSITFITFITRYEASDIRRASLSPYRCNSRATTGSTERALVTLW